VIQKLYNPLFFLFLGAHHPVSTAILSRHRLYLPCPSDPTLRDGRISALSGLDITFCFSEEVFRFQVSSFKFQVSSFRFQVSGFKFQVSSFRFQVSGFRFQVSGFKFQVSSFRFQVSGFKVSKFQSFQICVICGKKN
jgi:hypothetical protein